MTGTTFTDTTATPGVTYYYTVKAVSPLASSPASNEASAVVPVITAARSTELERRQPSRQRS